ncbi:CvpA family protein [Phenylobacterium sp.]|jgi:membrane protein required for colicin V production|uniref:CvpA family protein n=1 Tax=Phenylobacterium sp. TaxID=1871053 RepID=UPI002E31C765|nr:CvpA family protein [Phenylobacterium sp.]HEX3367419.1 CvpA family protein [Phenylobacterium sp.]
MGLGFTQFDAIVLVLLLISAAIGFARGAMLEIVSLFALAAATAVAVFGLHDAAPIARRFIHPDWLGTAAALVIVFVVVFVAIRLVGAIIVRQLQEAEFMGVLDRSLGLFLGLGRGLLVLGALNLMFNAATPKDLQPHWIVGSTTWPLAQNMGHLLTAMAPRGMDIAGRLKPAFDKAWHSAKHDAIDDRLKSEGYDARQRGEIEDLVEKSR